MNTITFAYDVLHLAPENPRRRGISDDAIVELALVIGRRGLLNPLRVTRAGGILAGQRRHLAIGCLIRWCEEGTIGSVLERVDGHLDPATLAMFEARALELDAGVPCVIDDGLPADASTDALVDNLHRADMLSYDVAEALVSRLDRPRLEGEPAVTLTRLAQDVGKSLSWVSRMVATYRKASPELHAAWSADRVPFEQARAIAELPDHDAQRAALAGHRAVGSRGRPGIDQVKAWRDRLRERLAAPGGREAFREHYGAGAELVLTALAVVTGEAPPDELERLLSA